MRNFIIPNSVLRGNRDSMREPGTRDDVLVGAHLALFPAIFILPLTCRQYLRHKLPLLRNLPMGHDRLAQPSLLPLQLRHP